MWVKKRYLSRIKAWLDQSLLFVFCICMLTKRQCQYLNIIKNAGWLHIILFSRKTIITLECISVYSSFPWDYIILSLSMGFVHQSSSTYWEGKSDMETLQRIYGISFPDNKMMKEWEKFQEEARNRDHRKIGKVHYFTVYFSFMLL